MCGVAAPEEIPPGPAGVKAWSKDHAAREHVSVMRTAKRAAMVLSPIILVMFAWAMWSTRATRPNVPQTVPIPTASSPSVEPNRSNLPVSTVLSPPHGIQNASALHPIPSRPDVSNNDPAKLWGQVKHGNANAEVALAMLYIQGHSLQQNCGQARLLLEAAANKGSARAMQLLTTSDYWAHCSN